MTMDRELELLRKIEALVVENAELRLALERMSARAAMAPQGSIRMVVRSALEPMSTRNMTDDERANPSVAITGATVLNPPVDDPGDQPLAITATRTLTHDAYIVLTGGEKDQ